MIKFIYIAIMFCVFFYGVIVGHHKVFPFEILSQNYSLFKKIKYKFEFQNNFSKHKKCITDINKETNLIKNLDYTFFIAGHAYGSPSGNNLGIYPKFYKELLNKKNIFDFGILAGDVTRDGDYKSWDFFDNQIKNFDYKIYIAPGNHDIGTTKI